jgi:hypothetical protein
LGQGGPGGECEACHQAMYSGVEKIKLHSAEYRLS